MDNTWLDDAFRAFQQENSEVTDESLTQMMLAFDYWAEERGEKLADVWRKARARKRLFDAADDLVREGFDFDQVVLILGGRIGVPASDEEPAYSMAAVTVYVEPED